MSLAERTREAAREHPFLVDALRAGVVNYTAAARFLEVDGDEDAVATALRRFADDLPADAGTGVDGSVRVSMQSGLDEVEDAADPLLVVGDAAFAEGGREFTAVVAVGAVGADALGVVLRRLAVEDVDVAAVGGTEGTLAVVVGRRDGANALRAVESMLDA